METITVLTSKAREVVDITNHINNLIARKKPKSELCHLFSAHTTAVLTTVYIDPEKELDLIGSFEIVLPQVRKRARQEFQHTHYISRMPGHILASFLGASLAVPIKNNRLMLGDFQRVVLVELNGPAKRGVVFMLG